MGGGQNQKIFLFALTNLGFLSLLITSLGQGGGIPKYMVDWNLYCLCLLHLHPCEYRWQCDQISPPLWHNFKTLSQYFEGLVSVGQNFEPTLANIWYYLANFHCSKWPNIKQIMYPSGRTDRWLPIAMCTTYIVKTYAVQWWC